MRLKLTALILFVTALGASLLILRQQRLEMAHHMATSHRQIDRSRQAIWDQQTRISRELETGELLRSIESAGLALEPANPLPPGAETEASGPLRRVHHAAPGPAPTPGRRVQP